MSNQQFQTHEPDGQGGTITMNHCVLCPFTHGLSSEVDRHFEKEHPDFTDKKGREAWERTMPGQPWPFSTART